jgi:hypothetical protein
VNQVEGKAVVIVDQDDHGASSICAAGLLAQKALQ